MIESSFTPNVSDNGQHGYLPRSEPGWYRKRFSVPAEWRARADVRVWLQFDGVFHTTAAYLDGKPLELGRGSLSGYTSFSSVPLELSTSEASAEHVLALRVDASFGSGHWYEGGGIYRNCWIIAAHELHVATDGLFVPALLPDKTEKSAGTELAAGAFINASAEVTNAGQSPASVAARFTVRLAPSAVVSAADAAAAPPVGSWTSPPQAVAAGGSAVLRMALPVAAPELWSIQSPALYSVAVEILGQLQDSAQGMAVVDSLNATTAFRSARFSAARLGSCAPRIAALRAWPSTPTSPCALHGGGGGGGVTRAAPSEPLARVGVGRRTALRSTASASCCAVSRTTTPSRAWAPPCRSV